MISGATSISYTVSPNGMGDGLVNGDYTCKTSVPQHADQTAESDSHTVTYNCTYLNPFKFRLSLILASGGKLEGGKFKPLKLRGSEVDRKGANLGFLY